MRVGTSRRAILPLIQAFLISGGMALLAGCDLHDALEGNVGAPYQGWGAEVDTVFVGGCESAGTVLVAVGFVRQIKDPDRVDQTQIRLSIPPDLTPGDTIGVDIRAYERGLVLYPPNLPGVRVVAQRLLTPDVIPPNDYVLTYFNVRDGTMYQPTFVGCSP